MHIPYQRLDREIDLGTVLFNGVFFATKHSNHGYGATDPYPAPINWSVLVVSQSALWARTGKL